MNRDNANRELNRLIAYYRELPFAELLGLAEQPAIETESTAPGGVVTFVVDVRHSAPDTLCLNVSAFGSNWFKLERIDESVVVSRETTPES